MRKRIYSDEERKERQKQAMKNWKEKDQEGFLDARHRAQKAYRIRVEQKRPGTVARYSKKYYDKNREKILDKRKKQYQENKEKIYKYNNEYIKEYQKKTKALRLIRKVSKKLEIKLYEVKKRDKHCKANGIDSYLKRSYSAGHIKGIGRSNGAHPEIWLGIYHYTLHQEMLLHFFHEVGHCVTESIYIDGYNTWDFEKIATEAGYQMAKHYGIEFSDELKRKFANEQKDCYENYK